MQKKKLDKIEFIKKWEKNINKRTSMKRTLPPVLISAMMVATLFLTQQYKSDSRLFELSRNGILDEAVITDRKRVIIDRNSFFLKAKITYRIGFDFNLYDHLGNEKRFSGQSPVSEELFVKLQIGSRIPLTIDPNNPHENHVGDILNISFFQLIKNRCLPYLTCGAVYLISLWGFYYLFLKKHKYICINCKAEFIDRLKPEQCNVCQKDVRTNLGLSELMTPYKNLIVKVICYGSILYACYFKFIAAQT